MPVKVVAEHGTEMDGAAVKAMTYTDAVIKEILRLHPIVGGVFRHALADFNLCGYHVPKVSQLTHTQPINQTATCCLQEHEQCLASDGECKAPGVIRARSRVPKASLRQTIKHLH